MTLTRISFYTNISNNKTKFTVSLPTRLLNVAHARSGFADTTALKDDNESFAEFLDGDEVVKATRSPEALALSVLLAWHLWPDKREPNVKRCQRLISKNGAYAAMSLHVYAALASRLMTLPASLSLSSFHRVDVRARSSYYLGVVLDKIAAKEKEIAAKRSEEQKEEQTDQKEKRKKVELRPNDVVTFAQQALRENPLIESCEDLRIVREGLQYLITVQLKGGDDDAGDGQDEDEGEEPTIAHHSRLSRSKLKSSKDWRFHDDLWKVEQNPTVITNFLAQTMQSVDFIYCRPNGLLTVEWLIPGKASLTMTAAQLDVLGWRSKVYSSAIPAPPSPLHGFFSSLSLSSPSSPRPSEDFINPAPGFSISDAVPTVEVPQDRYLAFIAWEARQAKRRASDLNDEPRASKRSRRSVATTDDDSSSDREETCGDLDSGSERDERVHTVDGEGPDPALMSAIQQDIDTRGVWVNTDTMEAVIEMCRFQGKRRRDGLAYLTSYIFDPPVIHDDKKLQRYLMKALRYLGDTPLRYLVCIVNTSGVSVPHWLAAVLHCERNIIYVVDSLCKEPRTEPFAFYESDPLSTKQLNLHFFAHHCGLLFKDKPRPRLQELPTRQQMASTCGFNTIEAVIAVSHPDWSPDESEWLMHINVDRTPPMLRELRDTPAKWQVPLSDFIAPPETDTIVVEEETFDSLQAAEQVWDVDM